MNLDDYPSILTVPEVAYELRLSRNGVRDLLNTGRLPGFKVGRKGWRIYKRELEMYLRTRGGQSETA